MSLHKLPEFVLSRFESEEALRNEDVSYFWNHFSNKESDVEDQRLRYARVAAFSLLKKPLMHHSVNNSGSLIYGKSCSELDVWTAWFLVLCDLDEQWSHLLLVQTCRGRWKIG